MSLCSVCNKQANFTCGHGCKTLYCGEKCAKSVYDTHQITNCINTFIGLEDAETIVRRSNVGSPATVYTSFYRYFQWLQAELTTHLHLNFIQKKWNKSKIEASVASFIAAAKELLRLRPDFDNWTRNNIINLRNYILTVAPTHINSTIEAPPSFSSN